MLCQLTVRVTCQQVPQPGLDATVGCAGLANRLFGVVAASMPSSPAVLFSSAGRSPPHSPRTPLHKTFTLQQKGKELGLGARRDRTLPKWILQQRRAERGLQLSSANADSTNDPLNSCHAFCALDPSAFIMLCRLSEHGI